MHLTALLCVSMLAQIGTSQTLRKYDRRDCRGSMAVCSVRTDVSRQQPWPQGSCCQAGVKRSGSLTISGVLAGVGELSVIYKGNFNTQCSVQREVYVGNPPGCVAGPSLGTGLWLNCAYRQSTPVFTNNCSSFKKRTIGNTTVEDDGMNATNSTDLSVDRPVDPYELASGFYDSLENPISEEEYWFQVEWEREHYPELYAHTMRDQALQIAERAPTTGIEIVAYTSDACNGETAAVVTTERQCVSSVNAASFDVVNLPVNCDVVIYQDDHCQESPYNAIDGQGATEPAQGCYSDADFSSLQVFCPH